MDNIFTKEQCLQWKLNKLINPKTNKRIEEGKGVYNKIAKQCSQYKSLSPIKDKPKPKSKSPSPIKDKPKSKSPLQLINDKDKFTKEDCLKWKLNKLINPKTNKRIEEGKGVYNKIAKQCSQYKSLSPIKDKPKPKSKSPLPLINNKDIFTKEECLQWKLNKLINPKTNKRIEEGKGVYNKISKQCAQYKSLSPIKDKPKSKSPSPIKDKPKSKSPSPIKDKPKYESGKKESVIYVINKSILDDLDNNQVIVDPAGLKYMKKDLTGAAGASGEIYKILSTSKPTTKVIEHFSQFENEDYLYEKNKKKNISVARYAVYNKKTINIIHTVGPNFAKSNYLKKIISSDDLTNLYKLYYKIYNDVYSEFIRRYNKNNQLQLRLLIVSTGIFIDHNKDYKIKIYKAFIEAYLRLNKEYDITPIIYLYKKDYDLIKELFSSKYKIKEHAEDSEDIEYSEEKEDSEISEISEDIEDIEEKDYKEVEEDEEYKDIKIKNDNNSCFLDSLLVALFHFKNKDIYNKFFTKSIINSFGNDDLKKLGNNIQNELYNIYLKINNKGSNSEEKYCSLFRKLLDRYYNIYIKINKTYKIFFNSNDNWKNTQIDVFELLTFLSIIFNFKNNKDNKILEGTNLYYSNFVIDVPSHYLFGNKRIDISDIVPLKIESFSLDDDNKFINSKGELVTSYKKTYEVLKSLSFVIIQIYRNIGSNNKLKTKIDYPDTIKLKENTKELELKSIIIHIGDSTNYGHYIALIKRNNIWYEYNDMQGVTLIDPDDAKAWSKYKKNIVGLVYAY
jgi:hypothetical protein